MEAISTAAVAFKESGTSEEQLFAQELVIMNKFRRASPWAGIFLGLSLGISLVSLSTRRIRTEYKPHRGKCVSCGRCFKYCPVEAKKII